MSMPMGRLRDGSCMLQIDEEEIHSWYMFKGPWLFRIKFLTKFFIDM